MWDEFFIYYIRRNKNSSRHIELFDSLKITTGIGVDEPKNKWAFDTSQFDNILKRLKVVILTFIFDFDLISFKKKLFLCFSVCKSFFLFLQQAAEIKDEGTSR